jgi:hypothetical protein
MTSLFAALQGLPSSRVPPEILNTAPEGRVKVTLLDQIAKPPVCKSINGVFKLAVLVILRVSVPPVPSPIIRLAMADGIALPRSMVAPPIMYTSLVPGTSPG